MHLKIIIIIFGISIIHSFFDVARDFVREKDTNGKPAQITQAKKPALKSLPNGFSRYKWGDNKNVLPSLEINKKINDKKVFYKLLADNSRIATELLGDNKPSDTYVLLSEDKLRNVVFMLPKKSTDKLLEHLTQNYGKPATGKGSDFQSYVWENKYTKMVMFIYSDKNYMLLQLSDNNYTNK